MESEQHRRKEVAALEKQFDQAIAGNNIQDAIDAMEKATAIVNQTSGSDANLRSTEEVVSHRASVVRSVQAQEAESRESHNHPSHPRSNRETA